MGGGKLEFIMPCLFFDAPRKTSKGFIYYKPPLKFPSRSPSF
ncbi:hypothetical protein JCM19274_4998 [Algibacter lectus]|uniref:Uncharacterized protein n=1 Tax=Algibacter lectus TaxID=221126 RepID=A0A090WJN7_9FLAO|nr:hypothetical protein JCM19274_4998 [Algibacter lectus]